MKFRVHIFIALLLLITSCAQTKINIAGGPEVPKWQIAKNIAYKYERTKKRKVRIALAKKGIIISEECIETTSKEPACYYFHAVNTGQYYQAKVIGYQKGIKTMIDDCNMVLSLDPSFSHGAAYRMLGRIFTELPPTAIKPDSIVRDLDKALNYLQDAINQDSEYPENWLALSASYLKIKDYPKSLKTLAHAKSLFPKWRKHEDYQAWKRESFKIAKKLRKKMKDKNALQL